MACSIAHALAFRTDCHTNASACCNSCPATPVSSRAVGQELQERSDDLQLFKPSFQDGHHRSRSDEHERLLNWRSKTPVTRHARTESNHLRRRFRAGVSTRASRNEISFQQRANCRYRLGLVNYLLQKISLWQPRTTLQNTRTSAIFRARNRGSLPAHRRP